MIELPDYLARDVIFRSGPPEPEDIPALASIPGRVTSFVIEPDFDAPNPLDDIIAKVAAEDARLRRMLPPAPPGMTWRGEVQSTETPEDFMHNVGPHVRIRYRLIDNRTGEDVIARWSAVGGA